MNHKTIEIGTRYGKLVVEAEAGVDHKNRLLYSCKCDCGNNKTVQAVKLRANRTKSCGCLSKHLELLDAQFLSFTVVKPIGTNKQRSMLWLCRCSCGHEIIKTSKSIISIHSKSNKSPFRCEGCQSTEHRVNMAFNYFLRYYKQGAQRRDLVFELSNEEFKELINSPCFYCNRPPTERIVGDRLKQPITANGIDRLDNNKGYTKENSVSCCSICNYAKRSMSVEEYVQHCQQVANHFPLRAP